MHVRRHRFWIILVGALALATLGWLFGVTQVAHADEITVCPTGPGTCDYANIQDAVDAAQDGDVIKIAAGRYTDTHIRPRHDISVTGEVTQVVYISKSLTLRGGYTTSFVEPPDPSTNATILDAGGEGRAVYITGAISPTLEGLQLTDGNASGLGGGGSPGSVQDGGGGLYVITATVTLSRCQVFSNTAYNGGGVYLSKSDAILQGNVVTDNLTLNDGGGVYLYYSDATVSGNTVYNNIADHYGGGAFLESGSPTFADNDWATNTASSGGGLYLNSSNATLTGNRWTANTAGSSGGGLYRNSGAPKITDNDFVLNDASYGGGLYLYSGGNAILSHNRVLSNTADNYGGGLYLNSSGVTFSYNTVRANIGGGRGGGVYLEGSAAILGGNVFVKNYASGDGGALYFRSSNGALLRNNIVADNQADNIGSGLYVYNSNITLQHNTIAHNLNGDGVGVFIGAGAYSSKYLTLINTILVSHTMGVSVTERCTVTLDSTLWGEGIWANDQNWGGAGHVTHTLGYTGTPDFVAPEAGDYHIGLDSAAIDRAIDLGLDHDIDGQPRPQSNGYEIGADETGLLVTKVATPTALQSNETLTYTIRVTNTSNVTLNATITDILPITVTPSYPPTWTPGDPLMWTAQITAPGGVWVQPVTVTVNPAYTGTLDNVVQVNAEQGPSGVTTNTVEVGITRAIAVGQRVQPDPVQAGERLSITLYVTNVGNVALDAVVTDTLPIHMERGIVDGRPVRSGDVLTWTTGFLTPTHTWRKSFSIKVAFGYSGTVTNRLQAREKIDGDTDTHIAYVTAQVKPSLDFTQLTKPTADVQAGERLTFTLWVQNDGNVDLTANITDTLPDQVTTSDQTIWHGQVIPATDSWIETIVVTVALNYAGPLTNVVTITTEEGVGGVYIPEAVQAHLTPAVSVGTRASAERVAAGERLTYTIQVTNTGNMDLHATVRDILPDQVTTHDPTTWSNQFLPARGSPWQRTIVVTTALGYQGPLTNRVEVETIEGATGSYSVTSQSLVTPALQIAKHADRDTVWAGERLTYTIQVTNTGNTDLHATITDNLPEHVTTGDQTTWTDQIIPAIGGTWQEEIVVTVEDGYGGTLLNTVEIETDEGATGSATALTLSRASQLDVTKYASHETVQAGQRLTYTIRVTNNGNVDLHAAITDTLPAHATTDDQTEWINQFIPASGGTWQRTVVVTVAERYAGPLTNVVRVATAEGVTGLDTATTTALFSPALAVTKHASADPVRPGTRLTYTLRVTNTGDVDLHAGITDVLPAHVTTTDPTTWADQFIPAPGGTWQRTVAVTVNAGYTGTLANVVQVGTTEGATGIYTITTTSRHFTPALVVTQQASADPVLAGERLTYTLWVTNTGDVDLHAIINDTLPDPVTTDDPTTWTNQLIPVSGAPWSRTVVVTVAADYAGPLTNEVSVTTREGATGHSIITTQAVTSVQPPTVYLPLVLNGH